MGTGTSRKARCRSRWPPSRQLWCPQVRLPRLPPPNRRHRSNPRRRLVRSTPCCGTLCAPRVMPPGWRPSSGCCLSPSMRPRHGSGVTSCCWRRWMHPGPRNRRYPVPRRPHRKAGRWRRDLPPTSTLCRPAQARVTRRRDRLALRLRIPEPPHFPPPAFSLRPPKPRHVRPRTARPVRALTG